MTLEDLFEAFGEEVTLPEEETFLLFTQPIPSQNLGFVDAKATELEIPISGRDLNIVQSPGLLSSDRKGGTTGAVVWRITPLLAEWLTSENNILFRTAVLDRDSIVLELGCGISGIVAIMLAPNIGRYIATDQDYVFKLLKPNIGNNPPKRKASIKAIHGGRATLASDLGPWSANIEVIALDWEASSVSNLLTLIRPGLDDKPRAVDAVIACDCIYNEALIDPFVQTCADICQLARVAPSGKLTLCIIAQQLRSDSVFEAWLLAFHKVFRVWRVPDELSLDGLRQGSGFVVHVGILRGTL